MKRTIIKIDEELCNGCSLCVDGCHEGALQMIDGKARMISDLYCDGLGACIGDCPVGAITLEMREAEPYDEIKVMDRISPNGEATVIAHLNHLIDHNQTEFVEQGIQYIIDKKLDVDLRKLKNYTSEEKETETPNKEEKMEIHAHNGGGCPGSRMMSFDRPEAATAAATSTATSIAQPSELRQWPVQLHLVNPQAPYFQNADVLMAADCVAFSMGNFHSKYLKGKGLAIACPKLDQGKEIYIDKLTAMIDHARINTLTVMVMEVPCCSGLLQMAKMASEKASRKVPVKALVVGLDGEIRSEEWM
ncbi:MAG: 4Fe-4S ferredoxin [Bacteroidetes bacterium]|nr:MAG: 4Fe-4S ferredoxin [Bacteroidota bacterium]